MRRPCKLCAGILVAVAVIFPAVSSNALAQSADVSSATATADLSTAERELFALNLYHEARSEGRDGMIAVGWVVLNRIDDPEFPDTITGVINQPTRRGCQWGWTCDGRSDRPEEEDKWVLAQEVRDVMLSNAPPTDPTGGAVFFHETFRQTPAYLRSGGTRSVTLGNHHFYTRN
jgi:spore germination cell wall hydrolase CwlJ-like protein